MSFNNFAKTVTYFSLLFEEQLTVTASDLHRFYKSRLLMTLSEYPIKQSLFTIGQEVVTLIKKINLY